MARFADLPAEILLQIMCKCRYIRRILRLASACTVTQQIWRDNVATIISALFSFTRSDLVHYIQLLQLEKTSIPPTCYLTELPDLNLLVQQHLRPLTSWSAGVRAFADLLNHEGSYHYLSSHRARLAYSKHLFLLLRRFVIGFHHPSLLPAAYATLHAASDYHVYMCYAITDAFRRHWQLYAPSMDLALAPSKDILSSVCDLLLTSAEPQLPRPWAFALDVFRCEFHWRPRQFRSRTPPSESPVVEAYGKFHKQYGGERVEGMFGGKGIPWAEEREEARRRENRRV